MNLKRGSTVVKASEVRKGMMIETPWGPMRVRQSSAVNDRLWRIAFSATDICNCRPDEKFTIVGDESCE